jgi:hypothetical protein
MLVRIHPKRLIVNQGHEGLGEVFAYAVKVTLMQPLQTMMLILLTYDSVRLVENKISASFGHAEFQ